MGGRDNIGLTEYLGNITGADSSCTKCMQGEQDIIKSAIKKYLFTSLERSVVSIFYLFLLVSLEPYDGSSAMPITWHQLAEYCDENLNH